MRPVAILIGTALALTIVFAFVFVFSGRGPHASASPNPQTFSAADCATLRQTDTAQRRTMANIEELVAYFRKTDRGSPIGPEELAASRAATDAATAKVLETCGPA